MLIENIRLAVAIIGGVAGLGSAVFGLLGSISNSKANNAAEKEAKKQKKEAKRNCHC